MNTLEPPRWPNGPQICETTNLPAFDSREALKAFFDGLPAISVKRVGLCGSCSKYHAETAEREPSGATSGTGTRSATGRLEWDVYNHQRLLSFAYVNGNPRKKASPFR